MDSNISNLSIISPDAKIGNGVKISPFVIIEADVVIGNNTEIQPNSHIQNGARIGENCKIFTGASIGAAPQDLKFDGEYKTLASVGDNTTVREYVTIHRGTEATGKTSVGKNCLLMAYSHVAHDCVVGDNVILANGVQLAGHVSVDDWAILGGLTGVHQFERVGKHAFIGACFRVMKDVPPYCIAGSEPLGFSGINIVGLRRRGFSDESIELISEAYRTIYRSGLNISDGVNKVEKAFQQTDEIKEIINFIRNSQRGVIPLARK
ncbi:MAG: acyl-ACP--UDP-N-acetylglucosamine O-acyltransferase [Chlorobiota bacterium]|nr:acyl-ACP--UDP-N-acetylglucosamine O-acyltransferase [Chlorobiota bacterium]QQS67722.1 MAG: acyl-ACP--UDP-N-acetylglucosamine O-acyltransferase [Chlorobiota bacterium]